MTQPTSTLLLPQHVECEQIILGSLLQYQEAVDFVWSRLAPSQFFDERNRLIYAEVHKLASEEIPITIQTVKAALEKAGTLERVGVGYLATLPDGVPRLDTLGHYVQEIEKASVQRRGISAAKNFATALMSGNGEIESATADLEKAIEKVRSNGNEKPPHLFEQLGEGRYKLVIPEARASLEVDRLRRESNELNGELCVRCELSGVQTYEGALSIADINLSSARARKDRANLLTGRSGSRQLDWTGHVEELCQRVLAAERSGQPAVDLREMDRPGPDDSLYVEGLKLPRRHPTILFGDGGSAKSYTGLYLAGRLVEQGLSVILIDWELAGEDHRDRLERLFGRVMPKVYYARCERPLVHEVDRLARIVRKDNIGFAIYDSVAFACDGPPESAEIAGRYFRAVRQVGIGSLHIAHITKSEGGDQKPFGSVFWHNGARSTYYVKLADSSPDGKTLSVGLFNRKSNLGGLHQPTGFLINFTEERTWFTKSDPADVPGLAENLPIRQRLKHLLRSGAVPIDEIAETLGAKPDTVRRTAGRYKAEFIFLEGGKVGLLQQFS